MHTRIKSALLFCLLALFCVTVSAGVSLERTIKAGKDGAFPERISAMVSDSDSNLYALDSENGLLFKFSSDNSTKVIKLSGSGKAFNSENVSGIDWFGDDRLLISNNGSEAVVVVDMDGKHVQAIAESGSEAGKFSDPADIAWSANRRLYVADRGNSRITVFGSDSVFIRTIGIAGLSEDSRLQSPSHVFVDAQERVYVLERRDGGVISIFDHTGKSLKRLTANGIAAITKSSEPELMAMTIDDRGLIYLADSNNGRVYQVDWEKPRLVSAFGSRGEQRGQFSEVTSLHVLQSGRVAVADSENKKIEIYSLSSSGQPKLVQRRLPTVGYERTIKLSCSDAYRLQGGNVLCLDRDNNRVSSFTASGRPAVKFEGEFSDPVAASIVDQEVVILDGEKIRIYRLDGKQRYEAGASGSSNGELSSPRGVYLRGEHIYVADTGNQRIQIFSRDGIYLGKVANLESGEPLFQEPVAVVVDSQNNMFVADEGAKKVLVFSPEHKLLYKIGAGENSPERFEKIHDISVDADNNFYIVAAIPGNGTTVQVYNGPKRIISFGSQSESPKGLEEPVTLSIAPARKTAVSVYDREKKALLNYKYLQLPARVGGLEISGSIKQAKLKWQKVPGSYISRYKVYASREENGPYRYITDVGGSEALVKHESTFADVYYRISAVSGFGIEGDMSNIRSDDFQIGYAYFRDLKYDKAAEIFSQSNQDSPGDGEILKHLGLSVMELGRVDEAVLYFGELSRLEGFASVGLNLQIKALVGIKDYVAAKAVVDKVIADNTASYDTIVYCGELSLIMGDAIGAVTCLEEAINKDDNNIKAHFLLGRAYINLGIIDQGLAEFKKAVAIDPGNAEVWYQSGMVFAAMGKYKESIEGFNTALELDAEHANAQLELARSHLALEQYDQVRNIAIKLAGNKDTAAEGQYLLGITALANNQNGQALLALTKSTRADDTNARAWLALADAYIKMGQKDKVRGALVSAFEGNVNSVEAAWRLGQHDMTDKKYEDAAKSLARVVSLKPDHYEAMMLLAESLYKSSSYKQANTQASNAARLKPDEIVPLVLLADISNKQGKNGKAIDYVKQAMDKKKNSAELHTMLGGFYVENSLFDLAKTNLEKAVLLDPNAVKPHLLIGAMYSGRRMFDEAIAELDKAVAIDPSSDNKLLLDTAYAEKKKSQEFKSNAPQIVLKDLRLQQVFSAAYKQYADRPVGAVRIQNTSATDYGNLKLTFTIKGYMDFPTSTEIPLLKANTTEEIDLKAAFNNRILEIDEDTGVQVEVAVKFVRDGRNDLISITQPMTIYGKNAILWGQPNMVGAFVTPKDDTVRDFVRQAINENKPESGPLSKHLVTAMTLFDIYSAHGIKYVIDPNSPYSKVANDRVDYVQFSRETLKLKSGDCDDLSVLLSTGLENLGVETAILDVPGHLLMMFNTGLPETSRDLISLDDELLVVRDGFVWIPVEATMIGTSFAEAWTEGARKYHLHSSKDELKVISLASAWEEYLPVTLKPSGYNLTIPAKAHVTQIVSREISRLLEKSLDRLVKPYRAMVSSNPDNARARMQIAIIFAKYGLDDAANREFDEILKNDPDNSAVHNNRGNIFFNHGDYERAIEQYSYAEKLASNDAGIKVNLSMASYKLGQLEQASDMFDDAVTINSEIAEKYVSYGKLLNQ